MENKIIKGSKIPSFSLNDQDGNEISFPDFIKGKSAIIYFYPKDDTPGCTKEACSFRDAYTSFSDAGVKVIGISADSVSSHKKFAEKHNLPFTLLADTKNKVRKLFNVPTTLLGLIPGRVTYVINSEGIVEEIFNSQFGIQKHIETALKILKKSN
ncbi:peroxiredoxin [Aureivirga sp. CE67]|uniref:peroxiredoxin n=1 Tax=Aureivirga sp. CE67 TaxID=1788983 RepID=UPI0018CBE63B|nr:peroxiredoxin [Aureivirga sp. CE67]